MANCVDILSSRHHGRRLLTSPRRFCHSSNLSETNIGSSHYFRSFRMSGRCRRQRTAAVETRLPDPTTLQMDRINHLFIGGDNNSTSQYAISRWSSVTDHHGLALEGAGVRHLASVPASKEHQSFNGRSPRSPSPSSHPSRFPPQFGRTSPLCI